MKPSTRSLLPIYHLLVTLLGLGLLIASTILFPPTQSVNRIGFILILAGFITFQVNFPLNLLLNEISLAPVMVLGAGLMVNPVAAGWAAVLGILTGTVIHVYRPGVYPRPPVQKWLLGASFSAGTQLVALFGAVYAAGWRGVTLEHEAVLAYLFAALLFALLHSALIFGDSLPQPVHPRTNLRRELVAFILIEFLPIPFLAGVVNAYPAAPLGMPLVLIGIPTIVITLMHLLKAERAELARREQELATLNQVSRVLRSTLNLDNLLAVIHQQVTQILSVDSFYVALYDSIENRVWYPLAVKHGQRQQWNPRPIMPDRLTDRVIREGKPILITPQASRGLVETGLPTSVETPEAWMGVPLVTSEHTNGCLAVFSVSNETQFTQDDLNLLTILSGQVSVAIENALLYEQTQLRATQLETLNRITGLIAGSLDTQEVLAMVCRSVAQVEDTPHTAIYLLDADQGEAWLAYSHGLSPDFAHQNQKFPLGQNSRTCSLRSGRPAFTPELNSSRLEKEFIDSLKKEGIQSFGDFPLITPNGQVGILTVYFEAQHSFQPEEAELLQTFASQAALAVANARLYARTDQALSRRVDQLAILEAVGRELSAAINSSRLFDMILGYALQFTNSPWGELSLYNPQTATLEVKASRGYKIAGKIFSLEDGFTGRAVRTLQPINIGDVRKDPSYIDLTDGASRSQLSIPLIHEGRVLGVLTIESALENAYSESDQAFIMQLTTQAAVAVVNAELYSETQRRLREQSVLYLVSTHLVANPELISILQTVARAMEASVPNVTVGIYLWDEGDQTYYSRYSIPAPTRPNCQLPEAIHEAELSPIRTSLLQTGQLRLPSEARGPAALLGTCLDCKPVVFPMVVKKQRLGMVLMHLPHDQVFQDEESQLLQAIVAQVCISLQNALLFLDVTHGRDRMAAVLNSVDEGIVMLESSGRILLANETVQKITSLTLAELVGQRLPDLPPRALEILGYTRSEAEYLAKNFGQGQAITSPKVSLKVAEAKPERIIERSTSPVWGQDGRIIGWMIVLRDVTEERQMAEARDLITETLVHDLRSPVGAVLSAVEILNDNYPNQPRDELIDQALRVGRNSSMRFLGLIESLLDIAKLKSGRMDLSLTSFSLQTLVSNTLTEFLNQAAEIGVIIRSEISPNLPDLNADQSKITRVLTNLIDNALKFTPAGGQVVVSAEMVSNEEMIAIHVSDNGPGIPEEFREKIFDRFTQIPGQRGRRRGSGLGLTFCKLAVEAHGGHIWVDTRPGGGSLFTLTLPIEEKEVESSK